MLWAQRGAALVVVAAAAAAAAAVAWARFRLGSRGGRANSMCGYVLVVPGSAGEKRGGPGLKKVPGRAGRRVTVTVVMR